MEANKWYNVAMVVDKFQDLLIFYIDGQFMGSVDINAIDYNDLSSNYNLEFGRHYWTNGNNLTTTTDHYLNGFIDDFSFLDIPLTNEQINEYQNCPLTGNEEGLVGCWNFDEGYFDTYGPVIDISENGNSGIIENYCDDCENSGATYSILIPEDNCLGCVDPVACNYNSTATPNNESCIYEQFELGIDCDGNIIIADDNCNNGPYQYYAIASNGYDGISPPYGFPKSTAVEFYYTINGEEQLINSELFIGNTLNFSSEPYTEEPTAQTMVGL